MQVEDELYRISTDVFRDSEYFQEMFDAPHIGYSGEGASDTHPIYLKGITTLEMNSFLDILTTPYV